MSNNKIRGIRFALIAALVSGVSIFVNKFAVTAIQEPLIFTTVKNTAVAILILLFLLASGKLKEIKKLKSREVKLLVLIGIVGGSIPFYLFFTGLSIIPAINSAIIQKTLVLWVALFAVMFLGEKLSKKSWLIVMTLFLANLLVGGFKGFNFSIGEFYILAATVLWAIETVLAKKVLPNVDPDLLIEARMGIGAIILLFLSLLLKPQALIGVLTLTPDKWMWVAVTTGLLITYVTFWYRGLKHAPATSATSVLVGSTLVTNILSAIFVTHTLNTLIVIQSLLIAFGIGILYKLEISTPVSSKNVTFS
jgi:drug/metabolite transporter (DMT)-like permease